MVCGMTTKRCHSKDRTRKEGRVDAADTSRRHFYNSHAKPRAFSPEMKSSPLSVIRQWTSEACVPKNEPHGVVHFLLPKARIPRA